MTSPHPAGLIDSTVDVNPRNLLVIHFGQLGDVVLGLPAMRAIRDRFPDARRTAVVGAATSEIVKMSKLFDDVIPVDRVRLLRNNKVASSIEIISFAFSIRRKGFDFVIDLHSLPETNLLGFISGARHRLFSKRESRSLDFLSNFDPAPPSEDKTMHLSEYYQHVLSPLGISEKLEPFLFDRDIRNGSPKRPIVGLNPGAGHPSRRWPVEKFIELAQMLTGSVGVDVEVFLGPEESELAQDVEAALAGKCSIVQGLSLHDLAQKFSRLSCLVSNDTGPIHIAAASGVSLVLVLQNAAPDRYLPLTHNIAVHRGELLQNILVADVYMSVLDILKKPSDSAVEQ